MTDDTQAFSTASGLKNIADILIKERGQVMDSNSVPYAVLSVAPGTQGLVQGDILKARHADAINQHLGREYLKRNVPLAVTYNNGCLLTFEFAKRLMESVLGQESQMCRACKTVQYVKIQGGVLPDGDDSERIIATLLSPFRLLGGNQLVAVDFTGVVCRRETLTTIATALEKTQLKAFIMDNSGLDDRKAKIIADDIIGPNFLTMKVLSLRRNMITSKGAKALAAVIERCPGIERLELEVRSNSNEDDEDGLDDDEEAAENCRGHAIIKALSVMVESRRHCLPVFEHFTFESAFNLKTMGIFAQVVMKSKLTHLDLSGSTVTKPAISVLLQSLLTAPNVKLIKLNLSDIELSDKNVKLLAEVLERDTLVTLQANYCGINDRTFHLLLDVAGKAQTLDALCLRGNEIGKEGLGQLLLPSHKFANLTKLVIAENNYTGLPSDDMAEVTRLYHNVTIGSEDGLLTDGDNDDSSEDDGSDEEVTSRLARRVLVPPRRASSQNESDDEASDESSVHESQCTVRTTQAIKIWQNLLDFMSFPRGDTEIDRKYFKSLFRAAMRLNNAHSTIALSTCDDLANHACGPLTITRDDWIAFWLRHNQVEIEEDDEDDVDE